MGLEFVYQTKYESTIDTLALRENVKKISQRAREKLKKQLIKRGYDN